MTTIKKLAAVAAVATLALAATDLSASAQSSLTNGPNGMQPNKLASDSQTGVDGNAPSRGVYRQRPVRTVRSAETSRRPLTVAPHGGGRRGSGGGGAGAGRERGPRHADHRAARLRQQRVHAALPRHQRHLPGDGVTSPRTRW